MLVVYGDANEPIAAWRELEKYKNKIAPACLRTIYQTMVFTPPVPSGLRLVFPDISDAPVGNPTDVNDWNTLFDLPNNGTPFTSVYVLGTTTLILVGSTNITFTAADFSGYQVEIIDDEVGCIRDTTIKCMNCPALQSISFPRAVGVGKNAYESSTLQTANLPLVQAIGTQAFADLAALETLYIPVCTNLGGSVLDDLVFLGTVGDSNLVVTIDSSRATCNAGGPDGDLGYLIGNIPTATITYV
jgi:hypothetical protein